MLENNQDCTCYKQPRTTYCTNVCATCHIHGYRKHFAEPMEIEEKSVDDTNITRIVSDKSCTMPKKNIIFGGINISPSYQYPESWVNTIQNGVNNLCFSQIVGQPDEPLYTVLGFFPSKLQCTINAKQVSLDSVQTYVHSDKIIITGKKLECFSMENKGGCKELEVRRTIIIPIPMKHEQSEAIVIEHAHVYMLIVGWNLSL